MNNEDKIRPVQERLASIEGTTTFKDLREGFGGIANLTTQDLMAGLAMVRDKTRVAITKGEATDNQLLCPEILETYFGSTQTYRVTLVRSYLEHAKVDERHVVPHRMGATLAAQMMAGITFTQKQDAEFAYICNCRLMTLRDLRAHALQWYQELLDKAIPSFADALRDIVYARGVRRGAMLIHNSILHDAVEEAKRAAEAAKVAAQ
jgi:hypothetical protein